MTIQILQYEFLGPIRLDEWGPPMEKVVYLIFSRKKDTFNLIYVGDCEKTEEKNFFVNNPKFKCWIQTAGSEDSLYLAILPLFETNPAMRIGIVNKIILRYHPACNDDVAEAKSDYTVRQKMNFNNTDVSSNEPIESKEKISCPCCGSEMKKEKELENTTILKCSGCGLSDTKLNS